ncbi:MAG: hypothetical protein ACHQEA_02415 [Gaiellales bacterium]
MTGVRRVRFDDAAVVAMTDRLEAELLDTCDGVPGSGGLPAAEIFLPPSGGVVVAYIDNTPVACGGYYRRIPCWGPFAADPKSVCYEKILPGR